MILENTSICDIELSDLLENFDITFDLQTAIKIMFLTIDNTMFKIGELIGKYFLNFFPYEFNIKNNLGICQLNNKEYQDSFNTYEELLSFKNLSSENVNIILRNQSLSIPYIDYSTKIPHNIITSNFKLITLTITTCKRLNLFIKTINSFIHCCQDKYLIHEWICVDDNSSNDDTETMKKLFPFIKFILKTPEQRGHVHSMNIIKNLVKTPYILHLEDDWQFFRVKNYITDALEIINDNPLINQCLFNKNYSETSSDISSINGGIFNKTCKGTRYFIHEYSKNKEEEEDFLERNPNGNRVNFWPHFSLRPSIIKKEVLDKIGDFNINSNHFEMDYAIRFNGCGYVSAFFESICCIHIGRLTSERDDISKLNAYDLNEVSQFNGEKNIKYGIHIDELKFVLINLDKRPDRLENIMSIAPINLNRFRAIDGDKLSSSRQLQRLFENNDFNTRTGMVGCALSHIQLYINLVNDYIYKSYCIFEDDITFVPEFKEKIKIILEENSKTDWDIIYLGHHLRKEYIDEYVYDKNLFPKIVRFTMDETFEKSLGGTGGYIISKNGANKFLNFINRNGMQKCIDTMQQKSSDELNIYYSHPHLIYSECFVYESDTDTDIQKNYNSLSKTFKERMDEEVDYFGELRKINNIENIDSITITSYYILKNSREIDKIKECIHPWYIINLNTVIICPGRNDAVDRIKINDKWDIYSIYKNM